MGCLVRYRQFTQHKRMMKVTKHDEAAICWVNSIQLIGSHQGRDSLSVRVMHICLILADI